MMRKKDQKWAKQERNKKKKKILNRNEMEQKNKRN
jgi:hypothetical protein